MRKLFLAAVLGFLASSTSAQVTGQTTLPGTNFTVTATAADGTATVTKYQIDGSSLADLAWQVSQYLRISADEQNGSQFAIPTCLVDPSAVNSPPLGTVTTLDWTTSRIRFQQDGSMLSVTPTTGAVYRDAVRQGTAVVQKLCVFGASIYGKGRTSGAWVKWQGVSVAVPTGWITVPTDHDATVLD